MNKRHLLQRVNDIENQISILKKKLDDLPAGELQTSKCNNNYKWYDVSDNKRKYIRKKNRSFASSLAQKKLFQCQISDLESEHKAIICYLKQFDPDNSKTEKLLLNPEIQRLLAKPSHSFSESLLKWASAPFNSNPYYPEKLIHKSITGKMFRSKSETIIDMLLSQSGVPYRYESELILPTKTIYPDFTIRHPVTGELYYWEHFGLMENAEYCLSFFSKLESYLNVGIIPSKNLILTYETEASPLCADEVQFLINKYFL